ncbi:NAD-dependent epimerase/dehydratase family protein [Aerococcus urinaeequi]|uniref:NAD-dependent epimerase/dehydratase family protein n=1 Tax=Aerococcus urinaeequi TaxID=51665 RepID=UPI003D6C3C6E
MKKIVLTGAGGMLGTEILNLMKDDLNYEVFAITSQTEKLTYIYSEFSNINIFNIKQISQDIMNNSIFINCSFPRENDGYKLSRAIDYTENILQLFVKYKGKLFINISSQSVYKQSGDIIQTEFDEVSPSNMYGLTKYSIEKLVESYSVNNKQAFVNLRLGSLAGENFDQRMINRFIKKSLNGESIQVDRGNPIVSYLNINDAAEAILKVVKAESTKYNLYNLGNNDFMSIYELATYCANLVKESTNNTINILLNDTESNYNNVINNNRFYDEFNWQPQCDMQNLCKLIYEFISI